MSGFRSPVDCVYVTASTHDARYTRICVASIRYFYPEIPIRLLVGGRIQRGLARDLLGSWNVRTAEVSEAADYGWGFVKLEPLFGMPGEKFLVLDSDTVITGTVLDKWRDGAAPFLVDDETQSETERKRLYYDWEGIRTIDPSARRPRFVFNSGQWFGTAGILTRDDFASWVEWSMPRQLRHPNLFMPGDQGVLNYVLNQKAALEGLRVERRRIMRWPGHSMEGLDAESVSKRMASPVIIHWAGMKKTRLQKMIGGDILLYFEKFYYSRIPGGSVRRLWANCRDLLNHAQRWLFVRIKLATQNRIAPAISWRFSRRQKPTVGV